MFGFRCYYTFISNAADERELFDLVFIGEIIALTLKLHSVMQQTNIRLSENFLGPN